VSGAAPSPRRPLPLWVQLAFFAALGVSLTHAVHLALGARVATRALAHDQAILGRNVAKLVASQAAEAVLVNDLVTLNEIVRTAATGGGVSYCFIVRESTVLASSSPDDTPPGLVAAHDGGAPIIVIRNGKRYLDVAEPVLDGQPGTVRVGLDLSTLQSTRHALAVYLGAIAVAVIVLGIAAALLVGRRVGRPVRELLAAADRFDPAGKEIPVVPRGYAEIAVLAERFNRMMARLRTAHEEQVRAREKAVATERMAALGSLVAGVAHEVNNPIAGMKSCLHRLQTEELPPETRDEYLDLVEDGVTRVEGVMQRLLEFARPRPTRLEPVRLAELRREGVALIQPLLRERHISLRELDDGAGDVRVYADGRQVGQALLNLVLNASYVTPAGGELRVRLRRQGARAGIAIEDDGPGIPEAIRHRIMDPFFSTKPEGEGTGLGLSVTRTIAEAHGGELAFEFPARGTVATLWLREVPAGEAETPQARGALRSA
jgi:signal transduction histidine kinase